VTLPAGPFQLLYADPPWAFRTFAGRDRTPTQKSFREAEDHYPTMPFAEMVALPVADIAAKDAVLAMWIVGSHCAEALELGRAWGFEFVTDLFYWTKQRLVDAQQLDIFTGDLVPPKISMGYYTRKQVEPVWLFKRGNGLPVLSHAVRQLIVAPPREHSRKPAEAAERLEALFGEVTRLEMFCRTPRAGWTAWGNEVGKFEEAANG
jgi:N6-adenosine-specific RNA methylase IME4